MPEWLKRAIISVSVTVFLCALGWTWSLNSRLAIIENELTRQTDNLHIVSANATKIQVIESRLGYIERGIDDIKQILRGASP